MKYPSLFLFTALAMSVTGATQAQTIKISVSKQAQELQGIERPKTGMSKEAVEKAFGAPQVVNAAVGEPPISSWVYESFSVYFEHDKVIHTVLHDDNK